MCGITGWVDWNQDLTKHNSIIEAMTATMVARGPDAGGVWTTTHCTLGHRRLSVIDPVNGAQPMSRKIGNRTCTIVYNGELYNTNELRRQLENKGYLFRTDCDTEVLLFSFMEWGYDCVKKLNGIFAFAVWDDTDQTLFLARDRLGVKPLFFVHGQQSFLFGSEPKAILAHPDMKAEITKEGLAEIFALGPARTPGIGVYKHIEELKPGTWMVVKRKGILTHTYWSLESRTHEDGEEKTALKIQHLLQDTVERQLVSDVPICMLLSGGLDSSALTAFAVQHYKRLGLEMLSTFSVDFVDNDKHFKPNTFQPNADAPWIQRMSEYLGTFHHFVAFDTPDLVDSLKVAVDARDLPGMADVDGSLYLFCRKIKEKATVAVSGEAADEIFGGYPWFHRKEALEANIFPWSLTIRNRIDILSSDLADWMKPEQYVSERYRQALTEVPHLKGENEQQRRMREISYLNITRFMPTLLDRKDRMSMAASLEVRVPFCDHRLVEYVWNIPWEMKKLHGREKGILRKALEGILPEDVLYRKKSPYPKTHNPNYEKAVKQQLKEILHDPSSPLLPLVHVSKLRQMVESEKTTGEFPWFGQLMTRPQMYAFLIQVDYWLRKYKVSIP